MALPSARVSARAMLGLLISFAAATPPAPPANTRWWTSDSGLWSDEDNWSGASIDSAVSLSLCTEGATATVDGGYTRVPGS